MTLRKYKGGGRFEDVASYARARRVGPFFWVAGTTAIEPSGRLHAPGDAYAQTLYALARIEAAVRGIGAEMRHVTATRVYITGNEHAAGFARAHGEVFAGIEPVCTAVTAGLSQPGLVVEIEAEGVIHDDEGNIAGVMLASGGNR